MNTPRRPLFLPLAAAAALGALVAGRPGDADAGSLAPADVAIDVSGTVGPFWGSDAGELLYARGSPVGQELVTRGLGEFPDPVATAGQENPFVVGSDNEIWSAFHSGAMNERGDVAFVASTSLPDDPDTADDESLPRRGAYVRRGNTLIEVGRFGQPSPVLSDFTSGGDPTNALWASFFDAVPFGREGASALRVVFSAQLAAPDGRTGLFLWDETNELVTPLVLRGDPAPSGLPYATFGRLRSDEAGHLGFYAITRASPADPIVPGLFRIDTDGSIARVLAFGEGGDAAPGGGTFGLLQDFDLDGEGGLVFAATVEGGRGGSGLFRARAPLFEPEALLREGDTTPLGETYGTFTQAQVRADAAGTAVVMVPLTGRAGGTGVFFVPAGTVVAEPLGIVTEPITLASLGRGRVAYQTAVETRTLVPADGGGDGPADFRVALVDLKNSASPRAGQDSLQLDARFRLAPWGTGEGRAAPAALSIDAERLDPAAAIAPEALARIGEVRVQVSQSPGQTYVFGIAGTAADPKGTVSLNGFPGTVSKLRIAKAADGATWNFKLPNATGLLSLDLTKGVLRLSVPRADVFPSFDAQSFTVAVTLRTHDDVAQGRLGDAAYFHRSVRLDADQPTFGSGRRVTSRGERVPGGGFFVDAFKVSRSLRPVKGQAAPDVRSDSISMNAVVRMSPGSTPPTTPTLLADVTVGDFVLDRFALKRAGRGGSKYVGSGKVGAATVKLSYDALRGTFAFSARGAAPLAALPDADFTPGATVNPVKKAVGGIALPVHVRIDRAYESTFDLAITRLPGAKTFVR